MAELLRQVFRVKNVDLCSIELIELINKPASYSIKVVIQSDKKLLPYARKHLEITSAHAHPYKNYYYCYCDFDLDFATSRQSAIEQTVEIVKKNILDPLYHSIEELNFDSEINNLLTL